jgi:multicomponent Na+:H+ antiporter subunit C
MTVIALACAGWIFLAGVWGVVQSRNLLRTAICRGVAQSATYVLLLVVGYRSHATAPIYIGIPLSARTVDPVVHALAFVDIVVEAVVAALLLALAVQASRRHGTVDPDRLASKP